VTVGKLNIAPIYQHRILQGDIMSSSSLISVANQAGLTGGNPRFRGIVSEDVLPCLTTAEIPTALSNMRARTQGSNPLHIVTPRMRADNRGAHPAFTWLWPAEWRALIGNVDPILLAPSLEEIPA
jgi:hypothetical protein